MEESRPDPDALLRRMEEEEEKQEKGKLKIFFGYAAGVGKTYTMLQAAHEALQAGTDVVIGYIEPHTRPETMELTKGLEAVPVLSIQHGGIVLREFNLNAALKRAPQIMLVDELAHSNAEGCRHEKRYQDIRELLNAGIDVYTTVNVQHLESLKDVIAGITGVTVRERIPDFVFDDASQVELVDIEPEELLQRLHQGKIYREKQAEMAVNHFFTVENLVSLRETALRRMADKVNLIQEKSLTGGKEAAGTVQEHVLICLSPSPSNEKVIRQAARLANAFHGKFTAFFVETPEFVELRKEDLERLKKNTRLAQQLGAKTVTSNGSDIVEQIAEYAKAARVTKVVLGRSYTRRRMFSVRVSFSEQLVKLNPLLDIYLIPDSYDKKYIPIKSSKNKEHAAGYAYDCVTAAGILAGFTLLSYVFDYFQFDESNLVMLFLLSVLVTAWMTRYRLVSMVYSIVCVFVFNFCFTDPRFTFSVNDPGYLVTFFVMFTTAAISSSLTQKVKNYAKQMAKKSYRTELLLETSQRLQKAEGVREIARRTGEQLSKLLERDIYFYLGNPVINPRPIIVWAKEKKKKVIDRQEFAVACWTYKNNKHAGFSTTTLPGAKCLYLAVRNGDKVFAVIGIYMEGKEIPVFEESIMSAILNECAFALEKEELLSVKKEAEIRLNQEQLRSNLLRSISHDLRTPLTSISGNAGVLMSNGEMIPEEQRQVLYSNIYDDSMWLINLVENLLAVTRIENGTMHLNLQPELLDDIITESLKHINRKASEYRLTVEQEDDMLVAKLDAKLMMQVLINLVDNAIKYTPAGTLIQIRTRLRRDEILVEVADNGPGIEEEHKERLFDMFYTADNKLADGRRGMGLGLALCRSIIEAHGGTIKVRDNIPHGTVFYFLIKAEKVVLR